MEFSRCPLFANNINVHQETERNGIPTDEVYCANRNAISAEKLSPSVLFTDTEPVMSNNVDSPPSSISVAGDVPCSSGYVPSPATVDKGF